MEQSYTILHNLIIIAVAISIVTTAMIVVIRFATKYSSKCSAKTTIEFYTDSMDDQQALKRCLKSTDMAFVLWELQHNTWRQFKERDGNLTIEEIWNEINNLMEENHVNINELID